MTTQKITVLGWYDHNNAGDESYKIAFPKLFPKYDFVFTNEIRSEHRDCAAYVVGGGDIVFNKLLDTLQRIQGRKYLLSVSLCSCEAVEKVAGLFDLIAVRDLPSWERLRKHDIHAHYLPDVAHAMEPDPERGLQIIKEHFTADMDLYEKIVVVVMNANLLKRDDGFARDEATFLKLAYDLGYVADNVSASFVFLPFGYDAPTDDRVVNSWVRSKCKFYQKNAVIYDQLSPQDTLNVIAAANAGVYTRLHAGIFSVISNVPFVDLTHHDKTRWYMETAKLQSWMLNYWSLDRHKLIDLLNKHLQGQKSPTLESFSIQSKKALREFAQGVTLTPANPFSMPREKQTG